MRQVSPAQEAVWLSGDYTGTNKTQFRATIQKLNVALFPYDASVDGVLNEATTNRTGQFASVNFNQVHQPLELPNLASVSYSRDLDQPVGSCTMTFYNTEPLPLGAEPPDDYDFDQPGYFTYNRGSTAFPSSSFGYAANGWQDLLMPDRLIRTYGGYGFNAAVSPEDDENMSPTGVWLINEVQYTSAGMITVSCSDLARSLTDHICFPPVVPWAEYPLAFTHHYEVANPDIITATDTWKVPNYDTDSNVPYIGEGITDAGEPYVGPNGGINGHNGVDAFDSNPDTYWLSVGNKPDWSSAFEYVQGKFAHPRDINAVRINVRGGPYKVYVSVWNSVDDEWRGTKKIPYVSQQVDTHADIKFVASYSVLKGEVKILKLPKVYQNVTKVRVTFTHLWDSGIGTNYRYRAALQEMAVSALVSVSADGGTHTEGNYDDYTDIVKWFCAWGGLYWPNGAFLTQSDGTIQSLAPAANDPVFPNPPGGRVWGDFEQTGTYGPEELTVDTWDKKPLLDCITYVRDIVNFTFFVDETGGVIWRQPNIWAPGNYVTPDVGGPQVAPRTSEVVTLDESVVLLDLTAKISSANVREKIFVGNITGDFGAVVAGYNPAPSGFRRVTGWTDQRFQNEEECRKMADLIAIRQMFQYRQNSITIAATPKIQVDDQVRIVERVTNESFLHYVKAIQSDWDLATGEWTMELTTFWLGEGGAGATWAFDPAYLSAETQEYVYQLGLIAGTTGRSYFTSNLMNDDSDQKSTVGVTQSFKITQVATDFPARVRLYDTIAHRDADLARPYGDPVTGTGCYMDIRTTTSDLRKDGTWIGAAVTPHTDGDKVPITVTNKSGSTRRINVSFIWENV